MRLIAADAEATHLAGRHAGRHARRQASKPADRQAENENKTSRTSGGAVQGCSDYRGVRVTGVVRVLGGVTGGVLGF